MKKITNLILTGFFALLIFNSCSTDESSDLDDEPEVENTEGSETGNDQDTDDAETDNDQDDSDNETTSCDAPINLSIEVIKEDFLGDTLLLKWDSVGETEKWEITYNGGIWGSDEYTSYENEIEINSITDSATITIKSICSEDNESEIVTFPAIEKEEEIYSTMTAIVDGVSYLDLRPRSLFSVISMPSSYEIRLVGSSDGAVISQDEGIEINLTINKNHWKEGVYELKGNAVQSIDYDNDSYVRFYDFENEEIYDHLIEEVGVLEVTKFDLDEKIIEGTFSFKYSIYKIIGSEYVSQKKVENGTFKYSLDSEYFN